VTYDHCCGGVAGRSLEIFNILQNLAGSGILE